MIEIRNAASAGRRRFRFWPGAALPRRARTPSCPRWNGPVL